MKTVLRNARQVIEKMCALSKAFVLKIQVRLPLTSPRCFPGKFGRLYALRHMPESADISRFVAKYKIFFISSQMRNYTCCWDKLTFYSFYLPPGL